MDEVRKGSSRMATATVIAVAMALTLVLSGCSSDAKGATGGSGTGAGSKTRQVTLVAYSIPSAAYEEIIPAFQAKWERDNGEKVEFTQSFGGSGSQARAVIDGLEADIVHLAMEPDVAKIEESGLIEPGWRERGPQKAVPTNSLIVLGVRSGNPKGIRDWVDVSGKGIGVVTPNPKTSGGAQWNLLGSWGSVVLNGGSEKSAYDQVRQLYANTLVLDKNARDASNTFLQKKVGDVVLQWESDALIAKAEGADFDVVIPSSTILAETVATVVDSVVDERGTRDIAEAFIEFLYTPEAQRIFAEEGLRPVDPAILSEYADKYPAPETRLFTIDEFDGWATATPEFFGDDGVYTRIETDAAKGK